MQAISWNEYKLNEEKSYYDLAVSLETLKTTGIIRLTHYNLNTVSLCEIEVLIEKTRSLFKVYKAISERLGRWQNNELHCFNYHT